jgi:lysozyme
MNVRPDYTLLSKIIKEYEGFSETAYPDTGGVWTYGFGSTFNYDKNRKVQKGDVISMANAIMHLEIEVRQKVKELNHYIKKPLNMNQSTAIVDYVYNRGIGNMLKTQLDELINANPDDPRIPEVIKGTGLWDRMGNKLWGLGRRRRTQALLYSTGKLEFNFKRWS